MADLWKFVPVEPTLEMVGRGFDVCQCCYGGGKIIDLYRAMLAAAPEPPDAEPVRVVAGDYAYDGYLVGTIRKHSGQLRSIVEDDNGRLFIHRPDQLAPPKGGKP